MPHLTINGLTFENTFSSGEREHDLLGDDERAIDGSLVSTRTRRKKRWEVESIPLACATADAWATLLLGCGDTWKFADKYSWKGLAGTEAGTAPTYNQANGKFTGSVRVALAQNATIKWTLTGDDSLAASDANPRGDYTLGIWRLTSTGPDVWDHYLLRRIDGGAQTWYLNGALNGGAAPTWVTVNATTGEITLGDSAVGGHTLSDMFAFPAAFPTDWATALGAQTRAWPKTPRLEASGDLVSTVATAPITVKASRVSEKPSPHAADVAGKRISFTLSGV